MQNIKGLSFITGLCLCWLPGNTLYARDNAPSSYGGSRDNLHVYLLIGQSNMAGRAPFTSEEAAPVKRCYLFNGEGVWEPAKNPLNRHSTIRNVKKPGMNPGYAFSKAMLAKDNTISVGLVVNARGGTSIEQWAKGSEYYKETLRRASAAQQTGTLKGILWHQGESNRRRPDGYLDKLAALIKDLRDDLGSPSLPFVAGQIRQEDVTDAINAQIARLPETVPSTGFASSEGLTTMDGVHFDAKSMKILGERYAHQMLRVKNRQTSEDGAASRRRQP